MIFISTVGAENRLRKSVPCGEAMRKDALVRVKAAPLRR